MAEIKRRKPPKKKAASKTAGRPSTRVAAATLETLGASRLAAILDELAAGDAALKRRLKLELAAIHDPGAIAREVRKRIETLARSRAFVEWDKTRKLAHDLDDQRRAIVERIAPIGAGEALDLIWRFMGLAGPTHERCDDSNGEIGAVFSAACLDLGRLAASAKPDPKALAERCAAALFESDYAQFDDLIPAMAPALGADGLNHLKAQVTALAKSPAKKQAPEKEREVIGWSSRGAVYRDDFESRKSEWVTTTALKNIADALGDVDSYIAEIGEKARGVPKVAADVARRLLAAGRAGEAKVWLENASAERKREFVSGDWEAVYIETLEALGEREAAQAWRWQAFADRLDAGMLKDYLARLPDFDDVEAEDRAIAHARTYPNLTGAIVFLTQWPALDAAAETVLARKAEIDGNAWYALPDAAERLAGKHPLAATLLYRAMIDFTLTEARAKRYRHAARHLLESESLDRQIADYGGVPPHKDYLALLKSRHPRKIGFWNIVSGKFD